MNLILPHLLFLLSSVSLSVSVVCINGTFTYVKFGEDPFRRQGPFQSRTHAAKLKCKYAIDCGDHSFCFLRSWAARASHAWIVQRGCYQADVEDPLLRAVTWPVAGMQCLHRRLANAEYQVCLCQTDMCNKSTRALNSNLLAAFTVVLHHLLTINVN